MTRVMRTINRWRLADYDFWARVNAFNGDADVVRTDEPVAQVNLLRLHDRAYTGSYRIPHPRAIYSDVNVLLQSGLWHGTFADLENHPIHRHTDFIPGIYLQRLQAFVLFGRPFYEGHLFTVNDYFGAFNQEAYDNNELEHESLYSHRINGNSIDASEDDNDNIGLAPRWY